MLSNYRYSDGVIVEQNNVFVPVKCMIKNLGIKNPAIESPFSAFSQKGKACICLEKL